MPDPTVQNPILDVVVDLGCFDASYVRQYEPIIVSSTNKALTELGGTEMLYSGIDVDDESADSRLRSMNQQSTFGYRIHW